jgi:hypothetical protein
MGNGLFSEYVAEKRNFVGCCPVVTAYSMVEFYRRFGGTYCSHVQVEEQIQAEELNVGKL